MSLPTFRLKTSVWFCVLTLSLPATVFALPSAVTVKVSGMTGQEKQNVEAALGLPPGIVRDGQVDLRWLQRFVEKVPGLVERALQPFGYYRSVIKTDLQETTDVYRVDVQVTLGAPVRVRQLALRLTGAGAGEAELNTERRRFPLKQGDVLRHDLYDAGKKALQLKAIDLGYLKAAYPSHRITVHPDEDAADIELELETGPRYTFGQVNFEGGTDRFDEVFLRRFISFVPGDVFSHRELHRTRINFYQANRFDEVLMVPRMDLVKENQVPIDIKLVAGPQQRLRPGVGYGTNTGARLSLNYQNTQTFARPDLYTFDLHLAEKSQFMETSYSIPQAGSSENNLVATLGASQENLDAYESQVIYTELEETYGLGVGKTGSLYLRYSREDSTVGTDENLSRLLIPGLRYYQRSYDDPLNPKAGYQFRLELRGSYDGPLSDVTLGQFLGAGSFMWPLSRRFTLHTRVEAATTIKDKDLSEVPPSLRFFVGGDTSVRGYAYKSRGPRDENGDVAGGDSLLVGSIEGEYALNDNWGLAVFYDIGSAFNAVQEVTFISGAGVGVRRYTPIGPIKIDLASRVSEGGLGLRIHLSIGFDI
jgi:translocation and assembly module TamA